MLQHELHSQYIAENFIRLEASRMEDKFVQNLDYSNNEWKRMFSRPTCAATMAG